MPRYVEDLTGRRFGKLKVIDISGGRDSSNQIMWECKCDCGEELDVAGHSLRSHNTRSCGCLNTIDRQTHGMSDSPEYGVWAAMNDRCRNPNTASYKNYGARGIRVCFAWISSFEQFYEDMGPRPSDEYSIERINNDGN